MQYQREILSPDLWSELLPLMAGHWKELNPASDLPFCPDVATYEDCQAAGIFRLYTARTAERFLVGYSAFFVRHGLHCRDVLQASHDALWLHPLCRGTAGARFIIWCDEQLKQEGVMTVAQNSRLDHPIDSLLERLGYKATEKVYVRRLNQPSIIPDAILRTP